MTGKITEKRRVNLETFETIVEKVYWLNGKEVTRAEFDEAFPPQPLVGPNGECCYTPLSGWPIYSDSLAVHSKQVAEARADAEAKGVPTDFTTDGRPILRNREHRKKYMQAYGVFDRDGGYGDAQRHGTRATREGWAQQPKPERIDLKNARKAPRE